MRSGRAVVVRAAVLCALGLVGVGLCPVRARSESLQWLTAVEIRESATATHLNIQMANPVRVLGASPPGETRLIEIRIEPAPGPRSDDMLIRDEESLRVPVSAAEWLREIRIEPQTGGGGLLVVRFMKPVTYAVASDAGGMMVIVKVPKRDAPAPTAVVAPAAAPAAGSADELLALADEAMKTGAYPQAIAYYTKLVEMPEGPYSPIALEYLGLARQRNGQRAHARGEYELYLIRYPDGEGAERVRQRLDALRSARQPQRESLKAVEIVDRTEYDGYASLSTTYQRFEVFSDLTGAVLADSSQIVGLDMSGIARRGDWDGRVRASGYYRYDFTGQESIFGNRIGYLYVDVRNRAKRIRGIVGRQSGNGGGMLGRFDGARLDMGVSNGVDVGGVFGFPQVSSTNNSFDASRIFGGVRVAAVNWWDHFNGELYAIGQTADGLLDRVGIGTAMNYTGPLGSVSVDVDFDAYYVELNLAAISGSLALRRTTWLRVYADYRSVPFFTTRNALLGRPEWDLDQLEQTFTEAEIRDLARDRTAHVTTASVGLEQEIGSRFRLMGDVSAFAMSSTPSSGGVYGTPATGWEFAYTAQLLANDLLMEGDSNRATFRIFDGRLYTGYTLWLSARYPLFDRQIQITPLLAVGYRDMIQTRDVVSLDPGLQARYRYRYLSFEADVRGTWLKAVGNGDPRSYTDQLGYSLFLTVRLDI